MLRLLAGQVESLWDEVLPASVRELPGDLARLDRVLADPALLAPIAEAWEVGSRGQGRPSIPMESFVRDVGSGGVGLAASAAVLSDRDRASGSGRVDGAQARAPTGRWGRRGDDAAGDREGDA